MNDTPYPNYLIDSNCWDLIKSIDDHKDYLDQLLNRHWWSPSAGIMDYFEESIPSASEHPPEETEPQKLNWMKMGY